MTQDDLPFEGVKVLDLSQGVAGPYCGMHLARNGADVIKAEPPGSGCWSRQLGKWTGDHTAHSVIVNRAKRSLAVDLKTDEGAAIVQRLASDCDVFIQNYRVGKIDKFAAITDRCFANPFPYFFEMPDLVETIEYRLCFGLVNTVQTGII